MNAASKIPSLRFDAMRMPALTRRFRSVRAFSLVEVSFALAVISCSFLVMLGLLGTGLQSVRQSIAATTQAHIMQSIANNASCQYYPSTGIFTNAAGASPAVYYFDDEGNVLSSATGSIYTATVNSSSMKLPTSSASAGIAVSTSTASLLTVVIASVSNPNGVVTNTLVWPYMGN